MVVSCIVFIVAASPKVVLISGGILALMAPAALATYGRLFNRSQFDLVPPASSSKAQIS